MQDSGANSDSKLLYPEVTEKIIGVHYDVYNEAGRRFLKSVYGNYTHLALGSEGLSVQPEAPMPGCFRGSDTLLQMKRKKSAIIQVYPR